MSYVYTAVAVYYDPDDPLRFKNLSKTPTVTAKDLSTGNAIAGASVSNVDTGNYKVSVTFASKESVLFKVIPHNDDKDDFPDVSLLAEEVIFIADDILADTGDLKTRLSATRAGYLDKLNVAGVLANTNNASSFMANVASLALEATAQSIKAKTDNLPASPAGVGAAMTLTSAYDAAKTAASQLSVNAIPTTPLLAANYTAPDNASITAIKAKTDNLPASPAVAGEYTGALADIQTDLDNPSQYKADVSGLATSSALSTVGSNVSAIKGKTDNLPATPAAKGDKMLLDTNALDANAVKSDAVTKLQNGLALEVTLTAIKGAGWSAETLKAIKDAVDSIDSGLDAAGIRNAIGLASANLDTQLSGIKTDTGDIKTDTNNVATRLTATRAGYLDKLNVAGTLAHSGAAGTYKADVSSLALEATLTAIKGAGWTNETLKAIKDAADSGGGGGATPQQIWEYANRELSTPNNYKADVSGIPAAVWGFATRTLSSFGTLISDIWSFATRTLSAFGFTVATNSDANVTAIKAQTDKLPNNPAATGDAMTLTSAYDNAKADVLTPLATVDGKADAIKAKTDKIPNSPAQAGEYTNALTDIQTDLDNPGQYKADVSGLAKTTDLTGLAEKTDLSGLAKTTDLSGLAEKNDIPSVIDIQNGLAPAGEYDTQLDAAVSSRLASANYTAPDNAGIGDIKTDLGTVDGKIDAIKAKTDELTFTAPNVVDSSAVVDVTGIAEDIAEALEPIMPTPENIWTHAKRTLTMTPAEILSYIQQTAITQTRGNSWNIGIEDVSLPAAKQQIAIKCRTSQRDSESLLFIDTDGMVIINGEEYTDGGASLTYQGTTLTLKLDAKITALFHPDTYVYGIQGIDNNGVTEPYGGIFTIIADVVRAAE